MKSMSFKNRDEMVKGLKSIQSEMKVKSFFEDGFMWSKIDKDPDEVDVITDHLPEPKCGMDELVEKLADEEAAYWEMKAEIYYDI